LKFRSALFPVSQLAAAGASLTTWFILSSSQSPAEQAPAIEAFSSGSVLALVLTLGIPFILPNRFRNVDPGDWASTGPWSAQMSVMTTVVCLSSVLGLGLSAIPSMSVAGLTVCYAAGVAQSMHVAQVSRIRNNLAVFAVTFLPQLTLPLAWLVLEPILDSAFRTTICVSFFEVCLVFGMVTFTRRMSRISISHLRLALPSILRTALPMVPHLLLFSLLLQAPRIIEAYGGSAEDLAKVHLVMLPINVCATIAASINSILVVSVQTSAEDRLSSLQPKIAVAYATMGSLLSVFLYVFQVPLGSLVENYPNLSLTETLAVASVVASLSCYYSTSSLVLRAGATWLLPMASGASCLTFFALQVGGLGPLFIDYGVAVLALPIALFVVTLSLTTLRPTVAKLMAVNSMTYLPLLLVASPSIV
jgi:hypothetical protein